DRTEGRERDSIKCDKAQALLRGTKRKGTTAGLEKEIARGPGEANVRETRTANGRDVDIQR
ncbi:MAG: hypothetical protein OK454_10335, partial [Thaumarchaeota archaeon]|nr:hypothetical protein [Nitrososphaerota archaeon]